MSLDTSKTKVFDIKDWLRARTVALECLHTQSSPLQPPELTQNPFFTWQDSNINQRCQGCNRYTLWCQYTEERSASPLPSSIWVTLRPSQTGEEAETRRRTVREINMMAMMIHHWYRSRTVLCKKESAELSQLDFQVCQTKKLWFLCWDFS